MSTFGARDRRTMQREKYDKQKEGETPDRKARGKEKQRKTKERKVRGTERLELKQREEETLET